MPKKHRVDASHRVDTIAYYRWRGKHAKGKPVILFDREAWKRLTAKEKRHVIRHEVIERSERLKGKSANKAHGIAIKKAGRFSKSLIAKFKRIQREGMPKTALGPFLGATKERKKKRRRIP